MLSTIPDYRAVFFFANNRQTQQTKKMAKKGTTYMLHE